MNLKKLDLVIIGAEKAGTTSLKNYLYEHPQIVSHPQTEFSFFAVEEEFSQGYENAYSKYFNNAKVKSDQKLIAKNVSISFREYALKYLKNHNPNCELIFILRDPIKRAYSSYQMAVRDGWMDKPFDYVYEAIKQNKKNEYDVFFRFFIDLGLYHKQIKTVYKYFPKEKVHFVIYEEFVKDPQTTCSNIFQILGIEDNFKPDTERKYNKGGIVRSNSFSIILSLLRKNNNPLKSLVKSILPVKSFVSLGNWILSLNRKKGKYPEMDPQIKEDLKHFFSSHNELCSKLIEKDISKIWGY